MPILHSKPELQHERSSLDANVSGLLTWIGCLQCFPMQSPAVIEPTLQVRLKHLRFLLVPVLSSPRQCFEASLFLSYVPGPFLPMWRLPGTEFYPYAQRSSKSMRSAVAMLLLSIACAHAHSCLIAEAAGHRAGNHERVRARESRRRCRARARPASKHGILPGLPPTGCHRHPCPHSIRKIPALCVRKLPFRQGEPLYDDFYVLGDSPSFCG